MENSFVSSIRPLTTYLHRIADGEEVQEGVLEELLGGIHLVVTPEVISRLTESHHEVQNIFSLYMDPEGVLDTTLDITGRAWSPNMADTDKPKHQTDMQEMEAKGKSFVGLYHLLNDKRHSVVYCREGQSVMGPRHGEARTPLRIDTPIENTQGLPMPPYLAVALDGREQHPLVMTGHLGDDQLKIRAFIPVFYLSGMMVFPNDRQGILHMKSRRVPHAKLDNLREKLKGKLSIVKQYQTDQGGGFFEIPYLTK